MAANRLSAIFGLLSGAVAGFITRDDYVISTEEKIYSLGKQYQDNDQHLQTKIQQQKNSLRDIEQQIGFLKVQIQIEKQSNLNKQS